MIPEIGLQITSGQRLKVSFFQIKFTNRLKKNLQIHCQLFIKNEENMIAGRATISH